MAYEWARPGIKCVCINDNPGTGFKGLAPIKGETYILQSLAHLSKHQRKPQARFCDLSGYPLHKLGALYIERFRPLISQADDVEMFRLISEDSLGRLEAYEELLNEQFYVDETHG